MLNKGLEKLGRKGTYFDDDGKRKYYRGVFEESRLEEITLPSTLTEIGETTFKDACVKTVYVDEDCEVNLLELQIPKSTKVGPPPTTLVGTVRIWDLREPKDVVVPDGVEKVNNYWFWGSEVESIQIPASVVKIGTEVFCKCENLRLVTFAKDSRLEKIGDRCFCGSGIEEITLPKALREIGCLTFAACDRLRTIKVKTPHEIDFLNADVPNSA